MTTVTRPSARRLLPAALAALLAAAYLALGAAPAHATSSVAAARGVGWVRAAHLVPGVGSARVDLTPVDGGGSTTPVEMSPNATYGAVTPYQKVRPGTYTLTVRPSTGESNAPVLSRRFTLGKGAAVTLAIIGTAKAPSLATLQDDLAPPKAGAVNVRVFPAVSSANQLTVQATGGPTIVSDAVLGQASAYKTVPAGRWDLRVTADGMSPASGAVDLHAGGVYTVVVLDGAGGHGVTTKVVTDASGMASALPRGGAQTGAGGTAAGSDVEGVPAAPAALLLGLLPALAVGAALLAGRGARRLRPVPARR